MKQVLRQFFMIALILSLLLSTLGIQLIVHGLDEAPAPEAPAPEAPAPEAPAPEAPAPEAPAPEDPAPEEPAPENLVPENPALENPVFNAPILKAPMTKSVNIDLIIHPNNGYNAENITIPTTLKITENDYNQIIYEFTVDQSINSLLNYYNIKRPNELSQVDILKAFNPDSKEIFADVYPSNTDLQYSQGFWRTSSNFNDKKAIEEFKNVVDKQELHLIILWHLKTGQEWVENHIHCLFQPPFGPLLDQTYIDLDSGDRIYKLREQPEVNFYALEGGSLSYLYHGNASTRTADGKHFRIIGNTTGRWINRWVDIIYCMKESWANYPAQQAYIMPEPIPDEGYAFDYWEESRVPTLLENLYKKIENNEQNDNSLDYLIKHWSLDEPHQEPGDGALRWDSSNDFDNWYYSIMDTGITYIAHFKKIDDGSRLIPCPYGVCINQPTPYVAEPIVKPIINPIVKPIEKPAPLNLPRTASAQK